MDGQHSREVTLALTVVALVAVLLFAIVAAYVVHTSQRDEPRFGGTLNMGFMDKPDSLSPFVATSDAARTLFGLVYDCLHAVGQDMEPVPNLALNSTPAVGYDPFGSVWDYDITPNAVWHDGVPFGVDDVVFTMNVCALNYSEVWVYRPYTYFIQYAEKVDDDTVRVHFFDRETDEPMPVSFAESLLIPILPMHLLQNVSAVELSFEWQGYFEGSNPPMVGTGPFMATETIADDWLEGDSITLVRNPDYHWGVDRDMEVRFDGMKMSFYDDAIALSLSLEHGDLDVARLPLQQYLSMKDKVEDGSLRGVFLLDDLSCTQRMSAIEFNSYGVPNPSIYDVGIRRALAMATNKSAAVQGEYLGCAYEGSTLISPVMPEWHLQLDEEDVFPFDVEAASSLLEESGYRYTVDSTDIRVATSDSLAVQNGWVPENTTLSFRTVLLPDDYHLVDLAEQLAEDWSLIGVELNYTAYSGPAVPLTIPAQDLYISEHGGGDPDPGHPLFAWSSLGPFTLNPNHHGDFLNETYDELMMQSVGELDSTARIELVHECQQVFHTDVGAIVLAYPDSTYGYRTDTFEGWGDWVAHPGRSVDACWGGNELYFDLECIPAKIVDSLAVPLWSFAAMVGTALTAVVATCIVLSMRKGARPPEPPS